MAFELAAYFGIARQYFYMQMLEKAEYYLDRSLNGKCEEVTTGPRNLACTSIKQEKFFAGKTDKYDLKCFKVSRQRQLRIVDQTQGYL